ncbi:uncharacterized protein JN550_001032 [Neoarthrinium moseri]|uniref:uncharacterized protein n=1 Tax=Neoarthrinium moseri TaxID=1658444 RepID=UPI001FDC4F2D|nr:uncharacterized protein JN550_001032 [Neoarthrinium moseri]KAI1876960.1 hypothetical protein JN550_001032 [Neoarthrinium moseri]
MDYHSIHGQDISSFDLPSTHRLPTVSAADALEELQTDPSRFVSTGLKALDRVLSIEHDGASEGTEKPGGLQRGQVIEIWGPPGSGKTSFGLQLTSNALSTGGKVVWVDGFRPVCRSRLHGILEEVETPSTPGAEASAGERETRFLHFTCPSLAHIIALLCRPTASAIPQDVTLIVIDSLSALVNQAFPKVQESRKAPKAGLSASARRLQVLQSIISSLQKLAATRDITIVILSHSATRMQAERGAALIPAINAHSWEQGIATRLVLFRDWSAHGGELSGVYMAGLQKLNGKAYIDGIGPVFAFNIEARGLAAVGYDSTQTSLALLTAPPKRKLGDTDFEIADSEEDYGWEDEDTTQMPPNPSQWQGSEDILLGQHDEEGNRRDDVSDDESVHSEQSDPHGPSEQNLDNAKDEPS